MWFLDSRSLYTKSNTCRSFLALAARLAFERRYQRFLKLWKMSFHWVSLQAKFKKWNDLISHLNRKRNRIGSQPDILTKMPGAINMDSERDKQQGDQWWDFPDPRISFGFAQAMAMLRRIHWPLIVVVALLTLDSNTRETRVESLRNDLVELWIWVGCSRYFDCVTGRPLRNIVGKLNANFYIFVLFSEYCIKSRWIEWQTDFEFFYF